MDRLESRVLFDGGGEDLGEVLTPIAKTGSLAVDGASDAYPFHLEHDGWVSAAAFRTNNLGGYVMLELTGPHVDIKTDSSNSAVLNYLERPSPSTRLEAGDYTLSVIRRDNTVRVNPDVTQYEFDIVTSYAGDTTALALDTGELNSSQAFKGFLGTWPAVTAVSAAYYQFELDSPSFVTASATSAQGVTNLVIDQVVGGQLKNVGLYSQHNKSGAIQLAELSAGTFYISVGTAASEANYTLLVRSASPVVKTLKLTNATLENRVGSAVTLKGVALDANGIPIPSAPVGLEDAILNQSRSIAPTNANGYFSVTYSAAQTKAAGSGLFLDKFVSGPAKLYVPLDQSNSSRPVAVKNALIPLAGYSQLTNFGAIGLVYATSAADTVADLEALGYHPARYINPIGDALDSYLQKYVIDLAKNPLNDIAAAGVISCVPLPGNPACDAGIEFLGKSLTAEAIAPAVETIIEKDTLLTEKTKHQLEAAVGTAELTTGLVEIHKAFRAGESIVEKVDTAIGAIQDVKELGEETEKVVKDAEGKADGVQFTFNNAPGNDELIVEFKPARIPLKLR